MIMEAIDKYKLLATLVRGFFEAFTSGIIDCHVTDPREKYRPQTIKRVMLEHYGKVADVFHDTLFYPIAAINFDYDEVEAIVRAASDNHSTMYDIVKKVCADEQFYHAMIEEYKRNFGLLLTGHYSSVADHMRNYTHGDACTGTVDSDKAISLVTRTVMTAYAKGILQGGTGKTSLHQPTLLRLLLDSMTTLLHDRPLSMADGSNNNGVGGLFAKACRSAHNVDVMTDEMERTYDELVREEGIKAQDDKAN